jgi:hypothetical protein
MSDSLECRACRGSGLIIIRDPLGHALHPCYLCDSWPGVTPPKPPAPPAP